MFLYEGDCLKNVTVIRGVRYVTVSHYSGDKEVCDKLGDMLADAFRSCDLHEVTNASSSDVDIELLTATKGIVCGERSESYGRKSGSLLSA